MDKIIVLVTSGKHESVDYASIHLFDNHDDAVEFCLSKNTGARKYWVNADIVNAGEEIELLMPDGEY